MKLFKSPKMLWLAILLPILQTSCSKDSDLLAEYVVEESITAEKGASQNTSSDSSSSDAGNDESPADPDPQPENRNVEPGFFVTVNGSASNDGLTEATAWSLEHALEVVVPGDIVYVKAGNYDSAKISTSNGGSPGNPIKFVGYTSSPGDILALNGPTFGKDDWISNNQSLPDNIMPHLEANPSTPFIPESSDIGININHDYVEFHNFMLSEYHGAIRISSNNVVLDNIVGFQFGNWNSRSNCWNVQNDNFNCDNRTGYGIYTVLGTQQTGIAIRNSLIIDAGLAAYFMIDVTNSIIEDSEAYAYNPGNGSDYLFDAYGMRSSVIRNCYSERTYTGSLGHRSRALILQSISDNNVIENFSAKNARIQVENSRNNLLRNIKAQGAGDENSGGLQIFGQADNNLFINWEIWNSNAIMFLGITSAENQRTPHTSAGDDNYFINFIIHDLPNYGGNGVINFNRQSSYDSNNITAGTNYIIGLTAHNAPYLINANRPGTVYIYNSTFSNISNWDTSYSNWPDERETYTAIFDNVNFYNASNGFGNPLDDLNSKSSITGILNINPGFSNPSSRDFSLTNNSGLINVGINASSINQNANIDFEGRSRVMPYDVGAYEN